MVAEENSREVKMEIIEVEKKETTSILSIKGKMDVICAPEFERTMERRIHDGEIDFVIDFSEISQDSRWYETNEEKSLLRTHLSQEIVFFGDFYDDNPEKLRKIFWC